MNPRLVEELKRRTVFQVLEEAAASYGQAAALHQPIHQDGQRQYRSYTWLEYRDAALEIAAGLRALGIQKGDVVALDSETRAEFYLADLGIMANGSIAAALYTSYPAADLLRTIAACGSQSPVRGGPEDVSTVAERGSALLHPHDR